MAAHVRERRGLDSQIPQGESRVSTMLFSQPSEVFKSWIGPDVTEVPQVLPAVTTMHWGSLRYSLRRDAGSVLRCQEGKPGLPRTPPMTVSML